MYTKKITETPTDIEKLNNALLEELNLDAIETTPEEYFSLNSEELFSIDNKNLIILNEMKGYSTELFNLVYKPQKSLPIENLDKNMEIIQRQTISDITQPLNNMFNELAEIVCNSI